MQRLDTDESRIFFLCYHDVPRRHLLSGQVWRPWPLMAGFSHGMRRSACSGSSLYLARISALRSMTATGVGLKWCCPTLALLGNRHIEPGPGHGHGL
jgi:hypothetical protein